MTLATLSPDLRLHLLGLKKGTNAHYLLTPLVNSTFGENLDWKRLIMIGPVIPNFVPVDAHQYVSFFPKAKTQS